MDNVEKYDNILLGILQNEEKIQPFLDVIFNFLHRRTDFYKILHKDTDKLGFPPGVAEKLVYNAFNKYQNEARRSEEPQKNGDMITAGDESKILKLTEPVPHVEHVEEVVTSESAADSSDLKGCEKTEADMTTQKRIDQKVSQAEADSYNGAVCDGYSWSQSCNDVDVRIKIPVDIVKAKSVKVDIKHDHLTVVCWKAETGQWETVLDGQLSWRVNLEKSMWSLVPAECILVCLEKVDERWWESLLESEPKINVREIDAHKNFEELPDDEKAAVNELMFNQQQKLLGKPTSEEMKIQNILKDAWNKEGSPFKGQPFDSSVVNLCGGSANDCILSK